MEGRTRIYLTVDVECAEERLDPRAGAIVPPIGYDMQVWGRFANVREDLGIGLIMRELERAGLRGTFFVETVGRAFFGEAGLREVCGALRGRGHDVQLHLHPILAAPTFRTRGEAPIADDIGDYPLGEQVALLRAGVSALVAAGVPAEEVRAFRAGNFGANDATWTALREAGLRVGSNYNPCYRDKNCKIRFAGAASGLFETPEPGVYELPISCIAEQGGGFRHLQITALSLAEMIDALRQSRALGIGHVTIVTHSFEFYHLESARARRGKKNRMNVERLRGLCEFLRRNAAEFEVETVGALARRLPEADLPRVRAYARGRPLQRYRRVLEQGWKRVAARVPFL